MKTLSIIIPVYNSKCFLENCVSSIEEVNAYCIGWCISEIILVDDGSTDGSAELCDQIAEKKSCDHCRIKVIHQRNRGVSAARNAGLSAATGAFILFIDADDTVDPRRLAELLREIKPEEPIDMAVFGMSFDYYSGNRVYRRETVLPCVDGIKTIEECRSTLYDLFISNAISPIWNKLIRRSVIEAADIRLKEEMFLYEDLEFSLRVMAKCERIVFCREPIYHYRQAQDEGNAGRRLKRVKHIPEIVDNIENALKPFYGNDEILLSLYLVLAREKISAATANETRSVCSDFNKWIDAQGLFDKVCSNKYGMMLYNKQVGRLLIKNQLTKSRHKIANAAKKIGLIR